MFTAWKRLVVAMTLMTLFFGQVIPVWNLSANAQTAPRKVYNVMVFARFKGESEFIGNETIGGITRRQMIDQTYNQSVYSLREYYKSVSNQNIDMETVYLFADDQFSSFQLSNTRAFYSTYDASSNPQGYTGTMWERWPTWLEDWGSKVTQAFKDGRWLTSWDGRKLDLTLQDLDSDRDGKIDIISFVYSKDVTLKYGAKPNDVLWAYQGQTAHISVERNGQTLTSDRFSQSTIDFNEKAIYQEKQQDGTLFLTPSTIIHETGHVLGYQDLYYHLSPEYNPVHYMSVMAKQLSPVAQFMTAREREAKGWLDQTQVTELYEEGTYTLPPIKDVRQDEVICYKVRIPGNVKLWIYMEYRYVDDQNINRFDAKKGVKHLFKPDGKAADYIGLSKSGLSVYLVQEEMRGSPFPFNGDGMVNNAWGMEMLSDESYIRNTQTKSPRIESDPVLDYGYGKVRIQVLSHDDQEIKFSVSGSVFDLPNYSGAQPNAPAPSLGERGNVTLDDQTISNEILEYAYGTSAQQPDSSWQESTSFANLPAGSYYFFARVKGNSSHKPGAISSPSSVLVVPADATSCTVSFDGNGASGNMDSQIVPVGKYTLPDCTYRHPQNRLFLGWAAERADSALILPKSTYSLTKDVTFFAVWGEVPDVPDGTEKPYFEIKSKPEQPNIIQIKPRDMAKLQEIKKVTCIVAAFDENNTLVECNVKTASVTKDGMEISKPVSKTTVRVFILSDDVLSLIQEN